MNKIKSKIWLIIILLLLIGIIITIGAYFTYYMSRKSTDAAESSNELGTTSGNMQNKGYAVEHGDWIYFYDSGNLCKTEKDSDEYDIIIEDIHSVLDDPFDGNLNIAGDNIYFKTMHGTVYRVSVNGGKPKVFIKGETEPYLQGVNEFLIVGDWLYYNYEETSSKLLSRSSVIQRIGLNGRNNQTLIGKNSDEILWLLDVTDDHIYYTANDPEGGGFYNYRYSLEHSRSERIDFMSYSPSIQVADDWIYYRNDRTVNRIRTDGSDSQVLFSERYCFGMNVTEEWIYCLLSEDEQDIDSRFLMRMRKDGSDVQVFNDKTSHFAIVDDFLVSYTDGAIRIKEGAEGPYLEPGLGLVNENKEVKEKPIGIEASPKEIYDHITELTGIIFEIEDDGKEVKYRNGTVQTRYSYECENGGFVISYQEGVVASISSYGSVEMIEKIADFLIEEYNLGIDRGEFADNEMTDEGPVYCLYYNGNPSRGEKNFNIYNDKL